MGKCFLHGNGGDAALNFKVVGYATKEELLADTPAENTIGIITSTEITDWVFSATQPTGATGRVWISIGTSSTVEFNALKKNGIQVYPISAKQYISGVWADMTAKSYQGGEWVSWYNGELYDSGNTYDSITGGWHTAWWKMYDSENYVAPTLSLNNGNMTITKSASASAETGSVKTVNKIDLAKYSTVTFTFSAVTGPDAHAIVVFVTDDMGKTYVQSPAYTKVSKSGAQTVAVNIESLSGSYYVGIGISTYNGTYGINLVVTKVQLS